MATKALTHVAQRASHGTVGRLLDSEPGWRNLLINGDAEAVWRKILFLVKSSGRDQRRNSEQLTQEIFLHLLSTDRLNLYLEHRFTDEEITADLLSFLPD